MEVILLKNYLQLGYVGDTVEVANGFARNYLIPKGVCIEMSSRKGKHLKHKLEAINAQKAKAKVEAEERAKKIKGMILEFKLKVGSSGKSFGSITAKDLASALEDKGHEFDKKQLRFEPIKSAGEHSVKIRLHSEVEAEVTARVFEEKKEKNTSSSKKDVKDNDSSIEQSTSEDVVEN